MKPLGALQQLGRKFVRISKWEDTAALEKFVAGAEFFRLFESVPAYHRVSVMKCFLAASETCARRHPVAAPRQAKADWKKPGEIERFKRTWLKHGGNKNRIAREMGITEGAVGMAYSRFIRHGATATYTPVKNASRKPVERRELSQPPMGTNTNSESVARTLAAA